MRSLTAEAGAVGRGATSPAVRTLIPELDGVRGMAVLLVLWRHFLLIQQPPLPVRVDWLHIGGVLRLGWVGVDLFFVLSGFLITGILLDTSRAENRYSSFYARRALRILPLYFATLLAYFHVLLPAAHHFGHLRYLHSGMEPWFWLHVSNFRALFDPEGAGYLAHFWSLSVEEQFYLFWPLVVFGSGAKKLPWICLGVMAASFGLRWIYQQPTEQAYFLYGLTPFRLEPLAWGGLAAAMVRKPMMRARLGGAGVLAGLATAGAALFAGAVFQARSGEPIRPPMTTFGFTGLALMFSALVLYAYLNTGRDRLAPRLLRNGLLRSFGKYSYAIYVFHLPLFLICRPAVLKVFAMTPAAWKLQVWGLAVVAGFAACHGLAVISWRVLERRCWNWKERFAARG